MSPPVPLARCPFDATTGRLIDGYGLATVRKHRFTVRLGEAENGVPDPWVQSKRFWTERPLPLGSRSSGCCSLASAAAPERSRLRRPADRCALGGGGPKRAAKSLQVYVWQLRKVLGHEVLQTHRRPVIRSSLPPGRARPARFEALARRARRRIRAGRPRAAGSAWALSRSAARGIRRRAVRRDRGRPDRGASSRGARGADRGRPRSRTPRGACRRARSARASRASAREAARQLMVALYRVRPAGGALEVYREGRRTLVEELGIEPSRQLQELEQAILRQDPDARATSRRRGGHSARPGGAGAAGRRAARSAGGAQGRHRSRRRPRRLHRPDVADPEDVRAALQPVHAAAKSEIERHGGTVERLIGDALMSVFGAPVAHEDDPERAVRAALAIRQWLREEAHDLQVRIAVNTGVALVSVDARPREGEAIAAGDVVNTAQRILAGTSVDGILVGEQTYRATREAIEYRAVAPVEAKGKTEPIPVWEALEARSPARRRSCRRAPTAPLVGRQRELDLLVSALARVREERSPQLVTLVGVPGIGKSRLVSELSRIVDRAASRSRGARAAAFPTARASASGRSGRRSRRRPGSWSPTVRRRPRRSCEGSRRASSPRPARRDGSRSSSATRRR